MGANQQAGLDLSISELQNSITGGLNSVDPTRFINELSNAIGAAVGRELSPNGGSEYFIGDVRTRTPRRRGAYGVPGTVPGELGSDAEQVGRFVEDNVNRIISILGGSDRITTRVQLEAFAGPNGDQASAAIGTYLNDTLLRVFEDVGSAFSEGDLGSIAKDLAERAVITLTSAYTSASRQLDTAVDRVGLSFQAGDINFSEAIRLIEQAREVDLAFGQLTGTFSDLVQLASGSTKVDEFVSSLGGVSSAASALAGFRNSFSGDAQAFLDTVTYINTRLFAQIGGMPQGILDSRDALYRFAEGLDLTERSSLELYKILLENTDAFDRYFTLLEKQEDGYLSLAQTLGSRSQVFAEVERRVTDAFGKLEMLFQESGGFLNFDFKNGDPEYLVDVYKAILDSGITDTRILDQFQELAPLYRQYLDLLDENKVEIDEFLALIGGGTTDFRDAGASLRSVLATFADFAGVQVDLTDLPKTQDAFRDFFIANFAGATVPSELLNPLAIAANEYFDAIQEQSDKVTGALNDAFNSERSLLEKRLESTRALRDELRTAFDRESGVLTSAADGFKSLAKTIGDFRSTLYLTELGGQSLRQQTAQARLRLAELSTRAATGDQEAIREITTASSDYLSALQQTASSAAEYQRAVADVNRILIQTQADTLDAEAVSRAQLSALESLVSGQLDLAEKNRTVGQILAEINAKGEDTTGLQERLNALQELQNDLLGSIEQNTSGLAAAIQGFAAFFDSPTTSAIAERYLSLLESSAPPPPAQSMDGSPTVNQQQAQQLSQPSPQTQMTPQQMSDLLTEIKELHDSLIAGTAAIAGHTSKTARILERFDDGDALLTRVVQ